ncbi:MAG: hypothetical protein FJ006_06270 [Chloroflexi bacterium]|nr:hypothetical protein [Chloroflexota bacterium]
MRRFKLSEVIVVTLAVFLLVLPLAGCAKKVPPPPPPAGTISVQPAKIDQAMLKPLLPAVAKAAGLPEAAAAALPPCLSILAIPVKFSGSDWPANELVFIDLIIPPGIEVKGLTPGEDSVGIAVATADTTGKFEVNMEATAKLNWLLNTDWLPTVKPDLTKIKPLPNRVYTIRATGVDPLTVVTTTWELELLPPAEKPAEKPPAEKPAEGKLSFEAAEYTNAELGFSVKYPKDWKQDKSETLLFYAASPSMVPVIFVDAEEAATFAEALKKSLEGAGGSGFKVVSEKETTLADGTKATAAAIEVTLRGFGAKGFALGAKKDAKWILVTVGTVEMLAKYDEAKFSEIAHTLQFKK